MDTGPAETTQREGRRSAAEAVVVTATVETLEEGKNKMTAEAVGGTAGDGRRRTCTQAIREGTLEGEAATAAVAVLAAGQRRRPRRDRSPAGDELRRPTRQIGPTLRVATATITVTVIASHMVMPAVALQQTTAGMSIGKRREDKMMPTSALTTAKAIVTLAEKAEIIREGEGGLILTAIDIARATSNNNSITAGVRETTPSPAPMIVTEVFTAAAVVVAVICSTTRRRRTRRAAVAVVPLPMRMTRQRRTRRRASCTSSICAGTQTVTVAWMAPLQQQELLITPPPLPRRRRAKGVIKAPASARRRLTIGRLTMILRLVPG
jgi:hypothetical protein